MGVLFCISGINNHFYSLQQPVVNILFLFFYKGDKPMIILRPFFKMGGGNHHFPASYGYNNQRTAGQLQGGSE